MTASIMVGNPSHRPRPHIMMRPLLAACLALAWLPDAAAEAAHAPTTTPEWQQVEVIATTPGSVAARYQALLRAEVQADALLYGKQAQATQWLDSDAFRFGKATFTSADSQTAVEWHFADPGQARWPSRALRHEFAAGPDYHVRTEVHCDEPAETCAGFVQEARRIPAPRPPAPASAVADLQPWVTALAAWQKVVMRESCVEGPRHVPSPRYPATALTEGVTGVVVLKLLVNPCAQVRDVTVEKSSGSRELDRAAVDVARQWRLTMPADVPAGKGAKLRVPVTFDND